MEKQRKNVLLYIIVIILSVLVLLLSGYIFYTKSLNDKSSSSKSNENDSLVENNKTDSIDTNNSNSNSNSNNSQENINNSEDVVDETSYIRNTKVVLVEEPNCTGQHSTSLIANIEPNGNISIAQDRGAAEIVVGNAKYLYRVGILACDNVKLYYITGDNELYVIDRPSSTALNQEGTKVTDSKILEFLGTEAKDGDVYLKVLNSNKKIEYIKYFTSPNP